MVILFPKNHNPHFPLLRLFIRDTLLPIFIFLSCKVCLLQIHVPDVCGLAFWLFQSEFCVLCLLLAVLQAAPDLDILDFTIKGNSVSGNTKWQALPPTSLREVRALQDVIPGMLVKERKKNAHKFTCSASSLFSFHLYLQSGSLYSFKPGSKKNTQLTSAARSGFSISPSLTSQIFQLIHSHSRMEQLEVTYSLTEVSSEKLETPTSRAQGDQGRQAKMESRKEK